LGPEPAVVEGAQHLEAGEDPDDAVVFSPRELGIEVASHEHGGQVILRPGPTREDVAHAVQLDGAGYLRAPRDEEIAHLLVGIGEGEATEPSRLARPDLS